MNMDLSHDEFVAAANTPPAVIRTTVGLDLDVAPLTAYATLCEEEKYGFLLESGEKVPSSDPNGAFAPATEADRHARYSFVGFDPAAVITATGDMVSVDPLSPRYGPALGSDGEPADVLDAVRSVLPDVTLHGFPDRSRRKLDGGLVGFLAYEAVYDLFLDELGHDRPETGIPDAEFVLSDSTLVFDHLNDTIELVFTPVLTAEDDPSAVYDALCTQAERVRGLLTREPIETDGFRRSNSVAGSKPVYENAVERAKEHVLDGDIYQGVISRKRELSGEIDPLALYTALREINPSPYMYHLAFDDLTVVGASPETLVSVQAGEVLMNPLAGTCPRGDSPVEDRRLAGEMLADDKERAEHTMLVDLARNDVRRVSESGSVSVTEFMNVLKYSHVQHIESTVRGTLSPTCDAFDATRAAFPAGTLTGAPKIRAMEIIADLESEPRGLYGGGLGYYSWTGDADIAIVIRTATIETNRPSEKNHLTGGDNLTEDHLTVQAGAGIVADSDPTAEYEETEQKMSGVLDAIDVIETNPVPIRNPNQLQDPPESNPEPRGD